MLRYDVIAIKRDTFTNQSWLAEGGMESEWGIYGTTATLRTNSGHLPLSPPSRLSYARRYHNNKSRIGGQQLFRSPPRISAAHALGPVLSLSRRHWPASVDRQSI